MRSSATTPTPIVRAGASCARARGGRERRATTGRRLHRRHAACSCPTRERVEHGARIAGERVVRADVCVIGTGAGGAPVAKELAEGGMRVVMLEEGARFTRRRLHRAAARDDRAALPRRRADRRRVGNAPIMLPLGQQRWAARRWSTPAPASARRSRCSSMWRERFGLEALTPDELDPYFRRVERELNVAQVPPELAGQQRAGGQARRRRARLVGRLHLPQRARAAWARGVCAFGCPTSAKQHTGITYVPQRLGRGRDHLHAACRARRIVVEGGRARGVEATTAGGGTLRVDVRHGGRGLRRDPHAAAAAPQRPRRRVGPARAATSRSIPPPRCARCSTSRSTWRAACRSRSTSTSSPTRGSCSRAPPGRRTTWR